MGDLLVTTGVGVQDIPLKSFCGCVFFGGGGVMYAGGEKNERMSWVVYAVMKGVFSRFGSPCAQWLVSAQQNDI